MILLINYISLFFQFNVIIRKLITMYTFPYYKSEFINKIVSSSFNPLSDYLTSLFICILYSKGVILVIDLKAE